MVRKKEATLQDSFIKWLKQHGCKAWKNKQDATTPIGRPDVVFFKEGFWGWAEMKKAKNAKKRPGQDENVKWAKENSWGEFVYPENYEAIKKELEVILGK